MSGLIDRFSRTGGAGGETAEARMAASRRRRIWQIVIGANVLALVAAIAGCLFMMKSQGLQRDIAQMRDEVGEALTMMTLGGASEAVARYIPGLVDTTARWDRRFAAKRENFRGMDVEINQVQSMRRLAAMADRWRRDLEGVSPMQRNEIWQRSLKAQVENEQKKWPNRTHEKGTGEWLSDIWREFGFGMKQGLLWPYDVYAGGATLVRGGGAVDRLGVGDRLRYILFPYRLSAFTMLRLAGIALVTTGLGYLLCWLGLKSRLAWLSYVGLVYFLYLFNIAVFIVWLEVTK